MRVAPVACFALLVFILHTPRVQSRPEPQDSVQSKRIVNGYNAGYYDVPWQVSLRRYGQHICGGSLLSQSYVLTAAHCVDGPYPISAYTVHVGTLYRTSTLPGLRISRVVRHYYFNYSHLKGDVALLQLKTLAALSNTVKTIQLPAAGSKVPVGYNCLVSGWGLTKGGGTAANILQKAVLPIAYHSHCYSKNSFVAVDYTTMLCAGGQGRAGTCQADSGGPLACYEGGKYVLRGVVSWGHKMCYTDHYSVFARVSTFVNWIKDEAARG